MHRAVALFAEFGGVLTAFWTSASECVFMEGRAQVGAAMLENTDKHGEADGPEKSKARRGCSARGWSWHILPRHQIEEGADVQCSDFACLNLAAC